MNLNKFDAVLEEYILNVNPTPTQDAMINSALKSLLGIMLSEFPDAEGYAQGSYATDTLVKPLTSSQSSNGVAGEYDIDIVVERKGWDQAVESLDKVAEILEGDPTYSKMPIDNTKNSCVRIEYAESESGVKFHVDLVPTKNTDDERYVADRADKDWRPSDAKAFADMFNELAETQPELRSLAIILKRLRDRGKQTENIKSIMILTLIIECYQPQGNLMADLVAILESIINKIGTAGAIPVIENPVNRDEDLAEGIKSPVEMRNFFINLNDNLTTALSDDDEKALKEIFGSGFSYEPEALNSNKATVAAVIQPVRAYGTFEENL